MRRRLYYLLPEITSARRAMDDLLLARVEERYIHFLAKRGTPMSGLHEASVLQKTDMVQGAQLGLLLGAILGAATGALTLYLFQIGPEWRVLTLVGATMIGALYGMWVASMVGSAVPSSRLRKFETLIQSDLILLMIDVPEHRVQEVRALFASGHFDAIDQGIEPRIPVFP